MISPSSVISQLSIAFIVLVFSQTLHGQYTNPSSTGAFGLGMADITSVHIRPESAFSNAGSLGFIEQSSISTYFDSRYYIKGLYGAYLGGIVKKERSGFSADIYQYGWEDYKERAFSFGYGRQFSKNFSAGIKFKTYQFEIQDYGKNTTFSIDVGLVQKITDKFNAAIIISNPIGTNISVEDDLKASISIGFSYQFSDKFQTALEFYKDEEYELVGKMGIHYQLIKSVGLVMGYTTLENQLSFGIEYLPIDKVSLVMSSSFHPTLGMSSSLGVNYLFL